MDNKSVKICDEGMEKKIGSDVFFFSPLRYRIRVLIFVSRIRSRRWHRPSLIPQGWHYYCLIGCVTRTTHFFPRNYYFHRAFIARSPREKEGGRQLPFNINDDTHNVHLFPFSSIG